MRRFVVVLAKTGFAPLQFGPFRVGMFSDPSNEVIGLLQDLRANHPKDTILLFEFNDVNSWVWSAEKALELFSQRKFHEHLET